jgi:hypothetical protein
MHMIIRAVHGNRSGTIVFYDITDLEVEADFIFRTDQNP